MGKFSSLIEKFKKARDEIKSLGDELLEKYPQSKRLVEMAEEIDVAVMALDGLHSGLEQVFQDAEQEESLKKEMLEQLDASELYKEFSKKEKEQIAEFSVQNKKPIADEPMLVAYVEKSLAQKPTSDLIAMYPKATLIERGQQLSDGSEGFDAYSAGLDSLKKEFDADKAKAVKELAKLWFAKGIEAVVKEFYSEALKPEDTFEK